MTSYSKRLFSWNDVCLLFEHTHILNLLNFEDGFISFRACPNHEKLIGDSFYKAIWHVICKLQLKSNFWKSPGF